MRKQIHSSQSGTTLLETLIATAICMVAVFGLAGLVTMSTRQSKNMGSTLSMATTLAGQKVEQLLALTFTTATTDPQLCPCTVATAPCTCGSITSNVTNFVDYLRADGTATTAGAADVFFTRRWQVQATDTATFPLTMRRIWVWVQGRSVGASSSSSAPTADLFCIRGQL